MRFTATPVAPYLPKSMTAAGDTQLYSYAKYYKSISVPNDSVQFGEEVTITTGNAIGYIKTKFKGVPYGSAVNGWASSCFRFTEDPDPS
jgi:hypothetical protein